MLLALKAGATPLRTARQWLSVCPVSRFVPPRNCTPAQRITAVHVQSEEPCRRGVLLQENHLAVSDWSIRRAHRIKEGVVEADLVKVLAAHDLGGKDRICDADHLRR